MMAQSNAERYNVVIRIRIGFHNSELPTAQSHRPRVRTGAPPCTQGRHEALPRQCDKLQFFIGLQELYLTAIVEFTWLW